MANKATIWNPTTGQKQVTTVGQPMPTGYSLWTGGNATGQQAQNSITGSVPKAPVVNQNNAPMITGYKDGVAVQVPKGAYVPGVSLTPPPKINAGTTDTSKINGNLNKALSANEQLLKDQTTAGETASNDTYSTAIKGLADQIKSAMPTYDDNTAKANKEALISKQSQIRNLDLSTQTGVDLTGQKIIPMEEITGQQLAIQQQAQRVGTQLSNEEANLISQVNLDTQDRADVISGAKTLVDIQDKLQSHIDTAKKDVLDQANTLSTTARANLTTALSQLVGVDPDKMTAEQTAQLTQLAQQAGYPAELLFSGMRAVNLQQTLDNNTKNKDYGIIGEHYDENAGTMVKDYGFINKSTGQVTNTSGQPYTPGATSSTPSGDKVISTASGDSYDMSTYATSPTQASSVQKAIADAGTFKSANEIDNYINNTKGSPLDSSHIMTAAYGKGISPEALCGLIRVESIMGTSNVAKNNNNFGGITWSQNYQDSHPGTSKGTARPASEGGNYVKFPDTQSGVNAVAEQLANRKVDNGQPQVADIKKYEQYGLLSNTDFNPDTDATAKLYLDSYIKNATLPTAYSLGLGRGQGAANKFAKSQERAQELYYQATGSSLPDINILRDNKKIVTENNKVLNKNVILADTVGKNFDLAIKGEITSNVNQNATVINKILNPIYLALGDPAVNQAMVSNGTISQEFANLISIRNASGTTVADKEMANELIRFGTSVDAQKAVVERLKAEAMNIHSALVSQNAEIYKTIDPLETSKENPNRASKLTGQNNQSTQSMATPEANYLSQLGLGQDTSGSSDNSSSDGSVWNNVRSWFGLSPQKSFTDTIKGK